MAIAAGVVAGVVLLPVVIAPWSQAELTCRILKVTEEAGEAAGAWIGAIGQNPRKGVTHSLDDVAAELADVALVAIESLGMDARAVMDACAKKVSSRLPGTD